MNPSEEFRKQADIANKLAARSSKDADKAFWLRLSEDWLKLAIAAAENRENRENQANIAEKVAVQ
jgi:hypothetical protein